MARVLATILMGLVALAFLSVAALLPAPGKLRWKEIVAVVLILALATVAVTAGELVVLRMIWQ